MALKLMGWLLFIVTLMAPGISSASPQAPLLDDRQTRIDAWPAVQVLADPGLAWTLDDVLAELAPQS